MCLVDDLRGTNDRSDAASCRRTLSISPRALMLSRSHCGPLSLVVPWLGVPSRLNDRGIFLVQHDVDMVLLIRSHGPVETHAPVLAQVLCMTAFQQERPLNCGNVVSSLIKNEDAFRLQELFEALHHRNTLMLSGAGR